MADPINPALFVSAALARADSIVNPKCDDCGRSLTLPRPTPGPHQCSVCSDRADRQFRADFADWRSQERPRGRTLHVVKLPDCMRKRDDR